MTHHQYWICALSADVILQGKQWWCHKMLAVFSGCNKFQRSNYMYRVKNILHLYENIEEANVKTHSKPGTAHGFSHFYRRKLAVQKLMLSMVYLCEYKVIITFIPSSQLIQRSPLVRKQPTACLAKWWIQPSCCSCIIMASIHGKPVFPWKQKSSKEATFSHSFLNNE